MPHLVSTLLQRDSNIFFRVFNAVEQAKFNTSGMFGKNGKVDAVTHPGCAERMWVTEKGFYRSHKRAAHLSGIEAMLAMRNGGSDKS